jgi:hypothetical protein
MGEENDEFESCYLSIWEAVDDATIARRIEAEIKEAIEQRDKRLSRESNKLRKVKKKAKRIRDYQESARKREEIIYKVPLVRMLPIDDGNGTEGEHISQ